MMLPDLKRIAELELLSYGFENAQSLGIKIITTFQLCKEQLIAQPHYDFGMRNMKIVLEMSERAKIGAATGKNEEAMLIEIIRKTISCTLDVEDLPLFEVKFLKHLFRSDKVLTNIHFMKSILSDIFDTGNKCTTPSVSPIRQAIVDACTAQNINATTYFVEKVYQLYEMLHIRTGIMIVGDIGKTTTYRVLMKALEILEQQSPLTTTAEIKESQPLCTIINPKSVTIGQLYGGFDAKSHEWRDGILAINFKNFINATDDDGDNNGKSKRKWLIFDGPVDTVWMENINSVLDDNRKLCLTSEDIFYLNSSMNLLFEAMDLADASPAIVKPLFHLLFNSS